MPGTPVQDDIELIIEHRGKGGGTPPPAGGDDDGSGGGGARPLPARRYYTGMALGLVAIMMFFMALTSSYIVRKGFGNDWFQAPLPRILWVNTAILLVSSLTVERARQRLARGDYSGYRALWMLTMGLGALFLVGQLWAWRQFVAAGVYLAGNPASSFYYTLTGAHGIHLLGGIAALVYVAVRHFDRAKVTRSVAAEVASIYWHFMDGLWVFLMALLYLGG
jgi:cytochrome c oxidase subunit III